MKTTTAFALSLLFPFACFADDKTASARAAWAWATAQGQKAPCCEQCGKNCTCKPCTCVSAKAGPTQDKPQKWRCDVCQGQNKLCANCDGTGFVDYDPAKEGPKQGEETFESQLRAAFSATPGAVRSASFHPRKDGVVELRIGYQVWIIRGNTAHPYSMPPEAKLTAPAILILDMPRAARFWIQGEEQYTTGETRRVFESPPLEEGKVYTCTIRVKDIFGAEETRRIEVRAGLEVRQNFRADPAQLPAVQFQNFYPGPRVMRGGGC